MSVRGKYPPAFVYRRDMSEDELAYHVLREAQRAGCWGHHVRDSRLNAGDNGALDWLFLRPDNPDDPTSAVTLIWAELKDERYKASADQVRVLDLAKRVDRVAVGLWRPRHWDYITRLFRDGPIVGTDTPED